MKTLIARPTDGTACVVLTREEIVVLKRVLFHVPPTAHTRVETRLWREFKTLHMELTDAS